MYKNLSSDCNDISYVVGDKERRTPNEIQVKRSRVI
jgi:hypothetical protein